MIANETKQWEISPIRLSRHKRRAGTSFTRTGENLNSGRMNEAA